MADIAREYLENSLENEYILNMNQESNRNEIETHDKIQESESILTHSSSYVLARNDSQLSGDVDRWIGDSPTEVPLRGIRPSGIQRSALISTQDSLLSNSFWYLAALVLPIFSTNTYSQWQCSPNAIYNSAGLLVAQLGRLCSHIRCQLRHISENTHARDVFATAMDIILVVYADDLKKNRESRGRSGSSPHASEHTELKMLQKPNSIHIELCHSLIMEELGTLNMFPNLTH